MSPKTKSKTRFKKLTPEQKKLAPKFIKEAMKSKYHHPRKQAIAIGLSKARRATDGSPLEKLSRKYSL